MNKRFKPILAAALGLIYLGMGTQFASAQSWSDQSWPDQSGAAQSGAEKSGPEKSGAALQAPGLATGSTPGAAADLAVASGPIIYVVDKRQQLATINLGTKSVRIIGKLPILLTDIGFQPGTHQLYGVSFTAFYAVNKTNATLTAVGSFPGVNDVNALVFSSRGTAYLAGVTTGDLYSLDLATRTFTVVGSTGGFRSAGDLTFNNGQLVLAGFVGTGNVTTSTPNYLVTLNPATGMHRGAGIAIPLKTTFGLASTGRNQLYGLGVLRSTEAGLYRLDPTNPVVAKRAVLEENLSTRGLGQILGAAYDGNFQP